MGRDHPETGSPAGANGSFGVLEELQARHPGVYSQSQLRALQRRVKEWRAGALLRFDDQWLGEDTLVEQGMHPTLWATTNDDRVLLPEATLG